MMSLRPIQNLITFKPSESKEVVYIILIIVTSPVDRLPKFQKFTHRSVQNNIIENKLSCITTITSGFTFIGNARQSPQGQWLSAMQQLCCRHILFCGLDQLVNITIAQISNICQAQLFIYLDHLSSDDTFNFD